jgi:hypothetical protein
MNCRKQPCEECPWRRDTPPGQFPPERYEALRNTTGSPGQEAPFDAPLFACHKSSEEETMPCAGWLASVGYYNLHVRMLLAEGKIPPEAMRPSENCPELIGSYAELERIHG